MDRSQIAFGDDPADALVGGADESSGDESVNHDHYLYGWATEIDAGPGPLRRSTRPRSRA